MLWRLREFIYFYKNPLVVYKDISNQENLTRTFNDDFEFVKIDHIDKLMEEKLSKEINMLGSESPFTLEDAISRLGCGEVFIIIFHKGDIAGWNWFAIGDVKCADFGCNLKLRAGQAYSYNTFVNKKYRGFNLATRLVVASETHLKTNKIESVWGIIYDWNVASQKAFIKAGYEIIGSYGVLNLFGF